jgi:oxygen-dependent protoporphyrinogen oxidase
LRRNKAASAAGPSGTLTSFNAGIGFLPESAALQLNQCIRTRMGASQIRRLKDAYEVTTTTGDTIEARAVVVAVPAFTAAKMTDGLDQHLPAALNGIPYSGLSVVCAGYRREDVGHDLNGFGFLAPRVEKLRALGCIWTSTIFPGRAPADWVMLRVMCGGSTDPDAVKLTDGELVALLEKDIHPLLEVRKRPEFLRVYRHERGIPQYHMGHGLRLKSIEAAEEHNPGLVFAGNAYRGVSLNDCVVSAHDAVAKVMKVIETS